MEISPERLQALNLGTLESKNLMETLAIDQSVLIKNTLGFNIPGIKNAKGIVSKMRLIGENIQSLKNTDYIENLTKHPSDTVRGWAAFAIGNLDQSLSEIIKKIIPLANDAHFGVREWAWLSLRPHVILHLDKALSLLEPLVFENSSNIRRFAVEITRPRGVWSAHINELKNNPAKGLGVLQPLMSEPEKYVQDSVGNWLNDASKSQPLWVKKLCVEWLRLSPSPETQRIIRKAQRSIDVLYQ
jgi:3-methyladenine DNA glycosylase AlkC